MTLKNLAYAKNLIIFVILLGVVDIIYSPFSSSVSNSLFNSPLGSLLLYLSLIISFIGSIALGVAILFVISYLIDKEKKTVESGNLILAKYLIVVHMLLKILEY